MRRTSPVGRDHTKLRSKRNACLDAETTRLGQRADIRTGLERHIEKMVEKNRSSVRLRTKAAIDRNAFWIGNAYAQVHEIDGRNAGVRDQDHRLD